MLEGVDPVTELRGCQWQVPRPSQMPHFNKKVHRLSTSMVGQHWHDVLFGPTATPISAVISMATTILLIPCTVIDICDVQQSLIGGWIKGSQLYKYISSSLTLISVTIIYWVLIGCLHRGWFHLLPLWLYNVSIALIISRLQLGTQRHGDVKKMIQGNLGQIWLQAIWCSSQISQPPTNSSPAWRQLKLQTSCLLLKSFSTLRPSAELHW